MTITSRFHRKFHQLKRFLYLRGRSIINNSIATIHPRSVEKQSTSFFCFFFLLLFSSFINRKILRNSSRRSREKEPWIARTLHSQNHVRPWWGQDPGFPQITTRHAQQGMPLHSRSPIFMIPSSQKGRANFKTTLPAISTDGYESTTILEQANRNYSSRERLLKP